jgi:hypothetical protein
MIHRLIGISCRLLFYYPHYKICCMNYDYQQSDLSRSVLGGLFAGIIAAVANILFVFFYRGITQFYEFTGIDVTVIVFGSILLSLTCGIVFYLLVHYLKKGLSVYQVLVVIITIAIIYFGLAYRQTVMGTVPMHFRVLVTGTQTIIGGLACLFIPWVFKHDSILG